MDAVVSRLASIDTQDSFVLVRVQVNDGRALVLCKDVNGSKSDRQEVSHMDSPLNSIALYARWDGEHWVLMLPSEY
jgi:hypothetical protein